jgi:hypothetical protein
LSLSLARYPPLMPAPASADIIARTRLPSLAVGAAFTAACMSATVMS